MSLTQGQALPDVKVTQQQTTTTPDFYTQYLTDIASQGAAGTAGAKFVGPTGLQQQAFQAVGQNVGTYQPYLTQAQQALTQASGQSASGALQPYLTQATSRDAPSAASPFIQAATVTSPLAAFTPFGAASAGMSGAQVAQPILEGALTKAPGMIQQYMDPYTSQVVAEIGRLGRENIENVLAPQATARAVGSGQFGSQRGAQVLGETIRDALSDISGKQASALSSGYQQAVTAAQADAARRLQGAVAAGQLTQADANRLAQLGATAGGLAGTEASNLLQAGQTTGQLTSQQIQNLLQAGQLAGGTTTADITSKIAAGQQLGALGTTAQQAGLADVNALATLGAQQQQIGQAEQLFPLQAAQLYANLLKGTQIPTSVASTYEGPLPGAYAPSTLQQIAGLGSLFAGLNAGTGATGSSLSSLLKGGLEGLTGLGKGIWDYFTNDGTLPTDLPEYDYTIPELDIPIPEIDYTEPTD